MYKTLLTSVLFLVGCSASDTTLPYNDINSYYKDGLELIYCKSDKNIPNELLFYTSNRETSLVPNSPNDTLMVFYITDVNGEFYAINSDELTNYTCLLVVPKVVK